MSSDVAERLHRATRSGRCIAAAVLIALMAAPTVLTLTSVVSPLVALTAVILLGIVSSALLYSVIAQVRRQAARERAVAAADVASRARVRSKEHIDFATSLGGRLRAVGAELVALRARSRDLEVRLAEAQTELAVTRDALFVSEAAEKRARAALVIAEQQPKAGRHLRPA